MKTTLPKADEPRNFPWRIAVVTTTDKDLAATNLSYLLGCAFTYVRYFMD